MVINKAGAGRAGLRRTFGRLTQGMLLGSLLLSGSAFAAVESYDFDVSVRIPTSEFYVLPVNSVFLEREQQMLWNLVHRNLRSLREPFDVKNSAGGISARLVEEPSLSNGRDSIGLKVTFNGQVLQTSATEVVPQAEARAGRQVILEIAAVEPVDGYQPGEYFGSVNIMFDAERP